MKKKLPVPEVTLPSKTTQEITVKVVTEHIFHKEDDYEEDFHQVFIKKNQLNFFGFEQGDPQYNIVGYGADVASPNDIKKGFINLNELIKAVYENGVMEGRAEAKAEIQEALGLRRRGL